MPDVEFIPLVTLGNDDGATTADFARSRGRWQALPDGWLSAKDMREALKEVCRIPEYDDAGAEAALLSMEDFLEARGSGRDREYRRVETPPQPMSPAQIFDAEDARRAELERERFEREENERLAASAEHDKVYLENNRRVHRELADEYTVPRIEALERRFAQLEAQLAQQGEPEATGAMSTPAPAPREAPAESRLAAARRFMFGDATDAEVERLLEEEAEE